MKRFWLIVPGLALLVIGFVIGMAIEREQHPSVEATKALALDKAFELTEPLAQAMRMCRDTLMWSEQAIVTCRLHLTLCQGMLGETPKDSHELQPPPGSDGPTRERDGHKRPDKGKASKGRASSEHPEEIERRLRP